MFTYPYQILQKLLTDSITELREVDWYLEQDSVSDKSAWLYASPIVFLEFVPVGDIILHGNKMQSMEVDVNVILLTENVMDSGKRMKKDSPLDHMRIYDSINKTMQGFNAKISYLPEFVGLLDTSQDQRILNSMNRLAQLTPPHRIRKTMMKSIQTFRTIIYDHSACKQYTKVTPTIDVDLEFDIPIFENVWDDTFDDSFGN